jgi:hypothetical protein
MKECRLSAHEMTRGRTSSDWFIARNCIILTTISLTLGIRGQSTLADDQNPGGGQVNARGDNPNIRPDSFLVSKHKICGAAGAEMVLNHHQGG